MNTSVNQHKPPPRQPRTITRHPPTTDSVSRVFTRQAAESVKGGATETSSLQYTITIMTKCELPIVQMDYSVPFLFSSYTHSVIDVVVP